MVAIKSIVAAAGILSLAQASPTTSHLTARLDYKDYRGDGTVAQGWPDISAWQDFETL